VLKVYVARLALVAIDKVRPRYEGRAHGIGGVSIPATRTVPRCMCMWITECPTRGKQRTGEHDLADTEYLTSGTSEKGVDRVQWGPFLFDSVAGLTHSPGGVLGFGDELD
jgi:hypothetical protein